MRSELLLIAENPDKRRYPTRVFRNVNLLRVLIGEIV